MLSVLWDILRHMEASARGFYNYLVGSRGEWRSKWNSNPLEVINYPALEISAENKLRSLWWEWDVVCACSALARL